MPFGQIDSKILVWGAGNWGQGLGRALRGLTIQRETPLCLSSGKPLYHI